MDFFFNDTATTEIYTLSLHDALPIFRTRDPPLQGRRLRVTDDGKHLLQLMTDGELKVWEPRTGTALLGPGALYTADRKSTRLNSSHANISYAVFCLTTITASNRHLRT